MPQDMESFRTRAEEIVKAEHPARKLIRKQEREKEITYLWGPNELADLRLTIFYGASKQEAADRMKATLDRLSVGPGQQRDGIGDEAYFFKTEINDSGGLRFRKDNVYVEVVAFSAKVAEDLAYSLAREIQKK